MAFNLGRFKFLSGDVSFPDYGGMMVWQAAPRIYHIIDLTDMVDACGRDATNKWSVQLKVIDLDVIPAREQLSALKSCGQDCIDEVPGAHAVLPEDLIVVECCAQHGAYAPAWQGDGDNYRALLNVARRASAEWAADHETSMDGGPVNGIGQTPREYCSGMDGLNAAIDRGVENGDQTAFLFARLYGRGV